MKKVLILALALEMSLCSVALGGEYEITYYAISQHIESQMNLGASWWAERWGGGAM